jgi:hypothetical protein
MLAFSRRQQAEFSEYPTTLSNDPLAAPLFL